MLGGEKWEQIGYYNYINKILGIRESKELGKCPRQRIIRNRSHESHDQQVALQCGQDFWRTVFNPDQEEEMEESRVKCGNNTLFKEKQH
jgi:hypothetical protein